MSKAQMNQTTIDKPRLPVILVVRDNEAKLASDSSLVASFKQIYLSLSENSQILLWIQQYQPDLIILDLSWSVIIDRGLVTALRLDWLTRNIPILVISDNFSYQPQLAKNLDYDACLIKPYSTKKLERLICSLVYNHPCQANAG